MNAPDRVGKGLVSGAEIWIPITEEVDNSVSRLAPASVGSSLFSDLAMQNHISHNVAQHIGNRSLGVAVLVGAMGLDIKVDLHRKLKVLLYELNREWVRVLFVEIARVVSDFEASASSLEHVDKVLNLLFHLFKRLSLAIDNELKLVLTEELAHDKLELEFHVLQNKNLVEIGLLVEIARQVGYETR